MQKWVRLNEVGAYLANGWRLVVIAEAPPLDYHPGWRLIEWR